MYRTIRTGDITFHVHQITYVQQIFEDNKDVKAYQNHLGEIESIRRDHQFKLNLHPFDIGREEIERMKADRDRKIKLLGKPVEPKDKTKIIKHRITLACGKQFKMDFNPLEEEYD